MRFLDIAGSAESDVAPRPSAVEGGRRRPTAAPGPHGPTLTAS
jgi:hypothetical protein